MDQLIYEVCSKCITYKTVEVSYGLKVTFSKAMQLAESVFYAVSAYGAGVFSNSLRLNSEVYTRVY